MKFSLNPIILLGSCAVLAVACGPEKPTENGTTGSTTKPVEVKPRIVPPDFNPDSAYAYVKVQADMGPRIPGSKAHTACVKWMSEKLKSYGAEVVIQNGVTTTFDQKKWSVKNVIASFNPEN